MRTEVNTSALKPYNKDNGFPPYMNTAPGGDDGFSLLSPDRYVEVRLGDQLNYYKKKTIKLERQLKIIQWSIFIIGGLGTLLAAINQQVWIALTTALAAALTTYLSYQQTEASLTKYNQTATDLANVRAWWMALSAEDQEKQENIDTMVDHTERVLESELDGWVQQMQNALTELRKSQAPQIDEEKAAAAKVPTKSGGGESGGGGGDNGGNGGGNAGGENAVSKNADGNIAADENAGLGASGDNNGTGDAEVGNAADGSAGEDAVGDEQPPGGNPVD